MKTILTNNGCSDSCNNEPLLKRNYLSEFRTSSQKEKARRNLGITDTVEWGNIIGNIKDQKDLIALIKCLINNEVDGITDDVKEMLSNLLSNINCNINCNCNCNNNSGGGDDNDGDDNDDNDGNNTCNCTDGNWALIFKATSDHNAPSLPTSSNEIEYQTTNIQASSDNNNNAKWTDVPSTDNSKYIWMAMLWEVSSEDDEETSDDEKSVGDWKGPYLMRFPQSTSSSEENDDKTYVTDVAVTSETSKTSNFKAATIKVTKNTTENPTTNTTDIYIPTIKNITLGTSDNDKNKLKITLTNGNEFTCDLSSLTNSSSSGSTTDVTVTQGCYSSSDDNTYEVGSIKVGNTTTTLYGIDTQGSSSTSVTLKKVSVEEVTE